MSSELELRIHDSIRDLDREMYNSLVPEDNPMLRYEFLEALESSGCVGAHTAWIPRHIVLYAGERIAATLTMYIKLDSYGEYIFDWEWARAYQSSGLAYYPKGVVAVPFTPTTGPRVLYDPVYGFEPCAKRLAGALIDLGRSMNLSSVHLLFITEEEQRTFEQYGFMSRLSHQYHWVNRDYRGFDDFLADIRSGRKKQIRKERRVLADSGVEICVFEGAEVEPEHIEALWQFYMDTNSRKWGTPYLTRGFFDSIYRGFRGHIVAVLARHEGRWIGGSFNITGGGRLFGRYWGCTEEHEFLHFECCYYRLIEYAIERGMDVFEAGAQGEHKFLRGFAAVPTHSSHFIFHAGAHRAISEFLERENAYTTRLIESYNTHSPLKYLYRPGIKE